MTLWPHLDCAGAADSGQPDPDPVLGSLRTTMMEQMEYNLLFRWFAGLGIDDPVWVPAVFSKNRDRQLTTAMSRRFCRTTTSRSMASW